MIWFRNLLSTFNLGHASFVGSSALVQLFPLLSAPIIARLYAPAEFGVYAVFFALCTILAGISALALTNATLIEAEDVDAAHATLLSMTVTVVFCSVILVLIFATPRSLMANMTGWVVIPYLPILPLSVLVSGIFTCLYTWMIRTKQFSLLARNGLVLGASTAALQIGIGLADVGAIGFIFANIAGYSLAIIILVRPFLLAINRLRPKFNVKSVVAQLKNHRDLPLWTVPANLVNSICSFLPELVIGRIFGVAQLGQFSLASRMVNFPLTFITRGALDIFRQQASEEFLETGRCRQSFDRFFVLMWMASIILLVPLILILPYVFPIIFGTQWRDAGVLIQAIGVLLIVRFVSSPLSYVWIIRGHYKLNFLWQIGLIVISLATLLGPGIINSDISLYNTLWCYSLGVGAWYLFCIVASRRFAYRRQSAVYPVPGACDEAAFRGGAEARSDL